MDISKLYGKNFSTKGLRNVFYPIEYSDNSEIQRWVSKSKYELNRYAQHIIALNTFEKENPAYYTCQAIHESLNSCSVSIVFSLFNIFAILTETKASFFDTSIRDYFMERIKPSFKDSYLLSFYWHESVLSMNSLGYSSDQYLKICFLEDGIGFTVLNSQDGKNYSETENHEITNSKIFYTFHLLQLLSSIDLVSNLLSPAKVKRPSSQTSQYLEIENYQSWRTISQYILKKIETAT